MVYTLQAIHQIRQSLAAIGATEVILQQNFEGIDYLMMAVGYMGTNYMFLYVDAEDYGIFSEQFPLYQWQGQLDIVSSIAEIYQALKVRSLISLG